MVVLSVGIVTKEGKILVCRQFVEISKSKIEGMYTSFLKLLTSSSSQQHTYVETSEVRYIYQPIENLYLCLITNKTSNILQDIDTLRMAHRVMQEYCREGFQEVYVIKNSFELILAFDDLVSLGYRENVTMAQIGTYLEMESSEEKFHKMLMKARENEAKEAAKKHALEAQRRKAQGLDPYPGGIEGSSYDASRDSTATSSSYDKPSSSSQMSSKPMSSTSSSRSSAAADKTKTSKAPKKSMKLKSKSSKQESAALASVDNESGADLFQEVQKASEETAAAESNQMEALLEPIHVEVEERLSAEINVDGELQSMEVKGKVFLTFLDPHKTKVALRMKPLDARKFNVRPHPFLNKSAWEEERNLTTEDPEGFPQGERILGLKYKMNKAAEKDLPFSIQFWGSKSGGKSVITLECEFNGRQKFLPSLSNIVFGFPLDESVDPEIKNIENGSTEYDGDSSVLSWTVPLMDKDNNDSAKIEFVTTADADSIFPITVNFSSEQPYANFELEEAINMGGDQSLNVKMIRELAAENFNIVSD